MSGRWTDDEEVRRFVDGQPSHLTFSEIAALTRVKFGDRAPSQDQIERHYHASGNGRKWKPSKIDRNGPLRLFIENRMGRLTLDETLAAVVAEFGRVTSRTAIHRFWTRRRALERRKKG